MKKFLLPIALAAGLALAAPAGAVDIPLYPTGPAQDAAFLRFADGLDEALRVTASDSASALELDAQRRVSDYQMVPGGTELSGTLTAGGEHAPVSLTLAPGEFVTVVGVRDQGGLAPLLLRETPEDFSAVKASVAFYNRNARCQPASVRVAGRQVDLFQDVAAGGQARRQVNPVALRVQLLCAGQPAGGPLDLGVLEAGERYTLFLVPGDPAHRFFHVKDAVAH